MNDMNELTNKLQQVMVPKAALIAYEYRENRYGNGTVSYTHLTLPTICSV